MAFTEKPPMLQGDTQQQINALRDYLFRMVSSLDNAANAPVTIAAASGNSGGDNQTDSDTLALIKKNAEDLKALIIKQADDITSIIDEKDGEYANKYFAKDTAYGQYKREILGDAQNYSYSMYERINNNLMDFQSVLAGQITRGFVEDPDNAGEVVLGIAISQDLQIDAETTPETDDYEKKYYKIKSNNFGLYTAQGWQFWVNGRKAGWFDSEKDGLLHVRKVVAENFFQVGGKWQLKISGSSGDELEFIYVG
ncbi:MAG: hypothetical protein IJI06_08670 [Oscillospiraceae bacterium]|nr:hypothetical protein [Oscillospiraceae bacterium]